MNILTTNHKDRTSLKLVRKKEVYDGTKQHKSFQIIQNYNFPSNCTSQTIFNSSNFQTKRSIQPLSNQIKSGSNGVNLKDSSSIPVNMIFKSKDNELCLNTNPNNNASLNNKDTKTLLIKRSRDFWQGI